MTQETPAGGNSSVLGAEEGGPLVYFPGLDGTGRLLHRQPGLDDHYRVHSVSYPQDRASTYTELSELAVPILEKEGPGVVLAESFGGGVALTLALRRPELIRRMVLVNTFAYYPRRALIRLGAWLGRLLPLKPSHPITRGLRGPFLFAPEVSPQERDEFWHRTADVPMRAYSRRVQMIVQLDLRSQLPSIRIPALVLVAPNDWVVPPAAGKDLARRLPFARLIERRVGHVALVHPQINVAGLLADNLEL
jgi:pimeloyl-ACP methyl ester carboxylesterase